MKYHHFLVRTVSRPGGSKTQCISMWPSKDDKTVCCVQHAEGNVTLGVLGSRLLLSAARLMCRATWVRKRALWLGGGQGERKTELCDWPSPSEFWTAVPVRGASRTGQQWLYPVSTVSAIRIQVQAKIPSDPRTSRYQQQPRSVSEGVRMICYQFQAPDCPCESVDCDGTSLWWSWLSLVTVQVTSSRGAIVRLVLASTFQPVYGLDWAGLKHEARIMFDFCPLDFLSS